MNKVEISQNFVMPQFRDAHQNQQKKQPKGQMIVVDPQTNDLYLLHQYQCFDTNDYRQLVTLLQSQAAQGKYSPYVLNPVVYLPIKFTNQMSHSSHMIQVLYEYGSHTLEQQLYLRINQQKNYFQQHQIWSILGSCILGLKHLKDNDFNHSSICMNDIFVTRQGQIKLCHPMLRTYDHEYSQSVEQNYFQRAICQNYYFAPQRLERQRYGSPSRYGINEFEVLDLYQQDVFSLAMVVVSLCYLTPLSSLYLKVGYGSKKSITFDVNVLEQMFLQLQQIYSETLLDLLFRMLAYNPQQRISIDTLGKIIGQMIQAKCEQQMNQDLSKFSFDSKTMTISNQQKQMKSEDKYNGKFSRISQATQISGNGTQRSEYKNRKINEADVEDKPSPLCPQFEKDYQNYDFSEQQIQNSQDSSIIDKTLKQYINNEQSYYVSQVNRTTVCNQFQEAMKNKNKNKFEPKQVVSVVMTSRELSSLPDDSVSIVLQKHAAVNKQMISNIRYNNIVQVQKENTPIFANFDNKNTNNQLNQNNFKLYLNDIKRQNNQNNQVFYQRNFNKYQNKVQNKNYITSARTYEEYNKQNYNINLGKNGFDVPIRINEPGNLVKFQNVNRNSIKSRENQGVKNSDFMKKSPLNSSLTISLNKDYQKMLQNQAKNPNTLFTDPSFLNAIREDVNKILKKRKITVTMGNSNENSMNSSPKDNNFAQKATHQNIYLNGKKLISQNKLSDGQNFSNLPMVNTHNTLKLR